MPEQQLTEKYNVAAPRYTSYPTMPYWDNTSFDLSKWTRSIQQSFKESNRKEGISVYIHLPFCENLCTYCGCNTRITKNHSVEVPYIEAVLKEWHMYRQTLGSTPVIGELHLGGGTPTFFSADNLQKLITGLLHGCEVRPDAVFSFEGHPANTTTAHLATLYELGFRRVSLGIQDFDPDVQRIINRQQSFAQVLDITRNARLIGYTSINFDLIYGLPLQTVAGLTNTIHLVEELRPDRIAFYNYAHVPWLKPGQRMFTEVDLPDPRLKSELHQTGKALLMAYGYQEIGMDHFALPGDGLLLAQSQGALHRNFMGYTHQHTQLLIGLGVSSISDSWYAFAQNVKSVEEYLRLVNVDEFPLLKGHTLNAEDLLLRRHILNLMCKGKTDWGADVNSLMTKVIERLKPLQEDKLLLIANQQLTITPRGKEFLRNICMAFDARLWANQPHTQLFSTAF